MIPDEASPQKKPPPKPVPLPSTRLPTLPIRTLYVYFSSHTHGGQTTPRNSLPPPCRKAIFSKKKKQALATATGIAPVFVFQNINQIRQYRIQLYLFYCHESNTIIAGLWVCRVRVSGNIMHLIICNYNNWLLKLGLQAMHTLMRHHPEQQNKQSTTVLNIVLIP